MTRSETAKLFMLLHAAYPQFYSNVNEVEANEALALWSDVFSDERSEVVGYALKRLIRTHGRFPPTIADVVEKIEELKSAARHEPTNEELWQILREGVMDGLFGAEEHFKEFPPVLKRYCGGPEWLRDHAVIELNIMDTVVKSQFMKQISDLKDRVEYEATLPDGLKAVLQDVSKGKVLNSGGEKQSLRPVLEGGGRVQ